MKKNIDFFCTRCRRPLRFPETYSGTIICCSYCGQQIIVPTITSSDWWSHPDENNNNFSTNELTNGYNVPIAPSVVSESEYPRIHTESSQEKDRLTFSPPPPFPLNDNEFLDRIQEEPQKQTINPPALPNGQSIVPPQTLKFPPPVIKNDPLAPEVPSYTRSRSKLSLLISYTIIAVFLIMITGTIFYAIIQTSSPNTTPTLDQINPVPIDGRVVYIDEQNVTQGDDGALIFLFPPNYPKGKSITTSTLSSRNPRPFVLNEVQKKLSEHGAQILMADSDGHFDTRILQQGPWNILVLSAHVLQNGLEQQDKELAEISQYLYSPEQMLLANHKFIWKQKQLDNQNYTVEYNMGRADGALLPSQPNSKNQKN